MQYDDFQKCAKLKCQSVHETYSIFLFRKDIVIKYTIKVFNGIDTWKIIIKKTSVMFQYLMRLLFILMFTTILWKKFIIFHVTHEETKA